MSLLENLDMLGFPAISRNLPQSPASTHHRAPGLRGAGIATSALCDKACTRAAVARAHATLTNWTISAMLYTGSICSYSCSLTYISRARPIPVWGKVCAAHLQSSSQSAIQHLQDEYESKPPTSAPGRYIGPS